MDKTDKQKNCQIPECGRPVTSGRSKYCGKCRYRIYRYGDHTKLHPSHGVGLTDEERFWNRVKKNSNDKGCWEWQGATYKNNPRQYGVVGFQGRQWLTHRLAWYFTHHHVDPELFILHECDNARCVNPSHLHEGTHEQNMQEMRNRHRSPRGSNRPNAVLNEQWVRQIKKLQQGGVRQCDIVRVLGIPRHLVQGVIYGPRGSWNHVTV